MIPLDKVRVLLSHLQLPPPFPHTLTMAAPDCRYEVQGEYVIPPDTRIPDSAASMAPMDLMGGRSGSALKAKAPKSAFDQATGRWRLQVIPPPPPHSLTLCSCLDLTSMHDRAGFHG